MDIDRPKKKTPTYISWSKAKERCNNKNHEKYSYYGGRGVKFCSEWNDFRIFLKDMGERPDGRTLDRINPYGNYCKENCRWATPLEQGRNKRKK